MAEDFQCDVFLPAAKITQIGQFTPRAWAREEAQQKLIALAA